MTTIQALTRNEQSDTQTLSLSSPHKHKIHKIEGLQRFRQLRHLHLPNNMIIKMQNLSFLINLKVLNLDFNQITCIENIRSLTRLEELSLSYNCIQTVPEDISYNHMLKVVHLAYNDIKSIEDIRQLNQLPSLSILSLAGNPFLAALNYITFIRMLIPSLLVLDSRDVNQSIITSNIQPHEEIFILRDALNKLIDQRNSMIQQQPQAIEQQSPIKERSLEGPKEVFLEHKHSFGKPPSLMIENSRKKLLDTIDEWIQANSCKLQVKKMEISQLSEDYSHRLSSRHIDNSSTFQYLDLYEKIKKYKTRKDQGLLSSSKKQKLFQLEKQLQLQQHNQEQKREQSRQTLSALKAKEHEFLRLKQKSNILKGIKQKILESVNEDPHKLMVSQIMNGQASFQLSYKSIKKYLFFPKGLIEIVELLNRIVFGQAADYERIVRLKQFLGQKSLIEIINNLKEMGVKHQKERKKYEKERIILIGKIEKEAEELCEQWKQLEKEKWRLKSNSSNYEVEEPKETFPHYVQVEQEEREKILALKKQKQHYQKKVESLRQSHEELQLEFDRKYRELEQFEKFFIDFKRDKEIASSLKQEKDELAQEVLEKQKLVVEIESNLKTLTHQEQLLEQKIVLHQRTHYEQTQSFNLLDQKTKQLLEKSKRTQDQYQSLQFQCSQVEQQIRRLEEQNKQLEKKVERGRNTHDLFEEKLKNLQQIESNKKNTIQSLEGEIQAEKKKLEDVYRKIDEAEEKLNHSIESNYQYQLKIQEGKKNIEALTDINHTLADMLERQNQLKRANLQLELENQHLLEVKGKLLDHIKNKYDDQDENL